MDRPEEHGDDEQLEMDDGFDEGIDVIGKTSFNGPKKIPSLLGIIPLRSTVSSPI